MKIKKILCGTLITLSIWSCQKDANDIVPELFGEPAAGIVDIDFESIDSNELIMNIDLFAVDHLGGFINNLSITDFTSEESNLASPRVNVIELNTITQEERGPFSATLLFDQSGSISGTDPMDARVEAGKKFAEIVNDGDEASIVAFTSGGAYNSPFEILTNFSDDPEVLIPPIEGLARNEGGGTPLYISTFEMCDHTDQNAKNENKAVIAFTDGADTDSGVSIDDLIAKACDTDVRIFTVGLGGGVSFSELSEIAFETGGAVMLAENAIQLVSLYNSMGELLHGRAELFKLRIKVQSSNGVFFQNQIVKYELKLRLSEDFIINIPIQKRIKSFDLLPFYKRVPDCPCNYDDVPQNSFKLCERGRWEKCGSLELLQDFHPGATFEVRWIPIDDDAPGQQCTYDENKQLITGGLAAGTPDKDAPNGCSGVSALDPGHIFWDVRPFSTADFSCIDYLNQWPPNMGDCSESNEIIPLNHMQKALKNISCYEVTTIINEARNGNYNKLLSDHLLFISILGSDDDFRTQLEQQKADGGIPAFTEIIFNKMIDNLK